MSTHKSPLALPKSENTTQKWFLQVHVIEAFIDSVAVGFNFVSLQSTEVIRADKFQVIFQKKIKQTSLETRTPTSSFHSYLIFNKGLKFRFSGRCRGEGSLRKEEGVGPGRPRSLAF